MKYALSPIRPDQFQLACDIMTAQESALNPEFGTVSIDEMQMFFTSRGTLTGHTLMLTLDGENDPVAVISITEDPVRGKFWTASGWLPTFDFADIVVEETIQLAKSLHPDWKFQPNVTVADKAYIEAYTSRGFTEIQRSHSMRIDFDGIYPSPQLPSGYSLRTLASDGDWISFHQMLNDAFDGHFGYVKRDLEDFKSFRTESAAFDPYGIFILTDITGEDVAFVESTNEIADMNRSFINTVGVIHAHHKKGLGKLVMQQAFAYASSQKRIGTELYVDIANSSGALRFYEGLGMRPISSIACLDNPAWAN